ncbi:MAG TPA: hypothetical protein VLI92_02115 [Candidatus Saccharimonadales bacterium]|nr:hypothetical protein [Candidatus Saccharimonadales bacterium]
MAAMASVTAGGKDVLVIINKVTRSTGDDNDPDTQVKVVFQVKLDGRERFLILRYFQSEPRRNPLLEQKEVLKAFLRYGGATPESAAAQVIIDHVIAETSRKEFVYK